MSRGLLWLTPAASLFAALLAGDAAAGFFSAVALITWVAINRLLVDLASDRRRWVDAIRWSFWAVACVGVSVSTASLYFHFLPKLAYSAITTIFLVATVCWASIRWSTSRIRPAQLVKEALALLIVVVWLLYADSDWYLTITMPFGTHHTTAYLITLPLWWWPANLIIPGVLLAAQARRLGLSPHAITTQWQTTMQAPWRPLRFIVAAGLLLVLLAALFLSLDFILPRVGHQIYEGDEFGYVVSAYQLLESGRITPPHMPLISFYIAAVFAIAGDSPTALLFANVGLVLVAVSFWIGTLWLMTSDVRVVLLGGLLMASLRTMYLFVWTPLSETLNNTLWSAALFFLLAAVRRPTWPFQAGLGLAIAFLLLCRSQNLGGVVGVLLVGTALTLLCRANRQALPSMITAAMIGCFVATAVVPLVAWGEYRKSTIGTFQIFDGRGAEIMLGMNSPGVKQGLDAGAWQPNVESWRAEHPHASATDMLLAAARFRLADPQETAQYLWYRALEFFNIRIPLLLQTGLEGVARPNVQLFIGLFASVLLLGGASRWIALLVWTVFVPFMATFLTIYSESRYRLPMDQFLTLGMIVLVTSCLFGTAVAFPERRVPTASTERRWSRRSILVASGLVLLAGALTAMNVRRGIHLPPFVAADLKPAGAAVVKQLPVDLYDYRHVPTFHDLLKEENAASLQGRLFCGQFELIGSLFKESLGYYNNNGVGDGARFIRGYPQDDYNIASLLGRADGARLKLDRVAISFANASIKQGVKQRDTVTVVGRVSRLNEYYSNFAATDGYWFLDALYVARLEGSIGQACGR